MKKEENKWLPLSFFPWESEFYTINCPVLKEFNGKKITLNNFPVKKAVIFKSFNDKRDAALLFSTTKDLFILFKSKIDRKEGLRKYRKEPPYWTDDTVELMIDPKHSHRQYYMFVTSALGKKESSLMTAGQGRVRYERKVSGEPANLKWESKIKITKTEWVTLVKIPYRSLGIEMDPSMVLGINFLRNRASEGKTVTTDIFNGNSIHSPWVFNDMVLEKKSVRVEKIFLDNMYADADNILCVTIRNIKKDTAEMILKVTVLTGEQYDYYSGNSVKFELKPEEKKDISLLYRLDPLEGGWLKIKVEILEQDGKISYSGDFHASFKNGMELAYAQPAHSFKDPKPEDPDFYINKRRYIMSSLPLFERVNTAQGAPGDFCIRSADKKIMFNLMKPGVLKKIADFIHHRFHNDIDRLLGAVYLIHQPAFMNYVNISAFVEDNLTPLSILRFQNAQCGSYADVLLGVLEKLRIGSTKKCWTGHILGLSGHMIMAVDAQVGCFFYKKGNKDLASIQDLIKDPWIADQAKNRYSRFFQDIKKLHLGYYGKVIWPENAPAE